MTKVLILDSGGAHALAIAESLKKAGYRVVMLSGDKNTYGYNTRFLDERYLCPDEHDKEYVAFVLNFLKEHKVDVIIPTSDNNAEFCYFYKEEIKKYAGILIPDREVFELGYDKNNLMRICRENGFPHPQTVDLKGWDGESEEMMEGFPYPGLLKPNLTSGARGMILVNSFEDLKRVYPAIHAEYGECHLQRFVRAGGRQVKVQIMTDWRGCPAFSSVIWKQRYYPVNGGSSCCNITIDEPEIAKVCGEVLEKIGWVGFADFDLIEDPDTKELLIMEINPRIPACVRSAIKSGMDYPRMIVDVTQGKPLGNYVYEPGKRLRHLGFDVLWFLKSADRFKAKPSWFRFFGKDTYYQDWVKWDIKPFIRGTYGNIKKIMNPEFRNKKTGMNAIKKNSQSTMRCNRGGVILYNTVSYNYGFGRLKAA